MGGNAVVGIVLGAGASTRLGQRKQVLPLGDTTLLGWVVREAERSSLDRVVVVVPDDEVAASLHPRRAEIVRVDPRGAGGRGDHGCTATVKAGLDLAGEADAVVLLLGDMPGVDAGIIDRMSSVRPAGAASYRGEVGHPLVFGAERFDDLRAMHGDKAVWRLLDGAEHVPFDRPLPRDVDTWDDYEAVQDQIVT